MRGWNLNLLLLVVAVGLTGAAWIVSYGESKNFTEVDKTPKLFEGFTPDNIRYVKLSIPKKKDEAAPSNGTPAKPDEEKKVDKKDEKDPKAQAERDELVFAKQDTTWKIASGDLQGVPVQMLDKVRSKVDSDLLEHFGKIRVPKKAVHKDSAEEYLKDKSLTDDKATIIQCYDINQQPIAELYLGKDASGGKWEDVTRGYFVRAKSSHDVIVYEVDYWVLPSKAEDWAERKILEMEQGKVVEFSLRNPKGEVAFKKDKATDAEWKCEKPPAGAGAIKQGDVTSQLVSRFTRVDATRYLGPLKPAQAPAKNLRELDLDPGTYEISAKTDDNKTYRLWIGKKTDKGEYYARAEGNDFLFALGDWFISPFDKSPADLFDPAVGTSRPTSGPDTATRENEKK